MYQVIRVINNIDDSVEKFDYLHELLADITLGNALDLLVMIDKHVKDTDEEKALMEKVIKDNILYRFDDR